MGLSPKPFIKNQKEDDNMILKNNSERVINLIRYFESLGIEHKLTLIAFKKRINKI